MTETTKIGPVCFDADGEAWKLEFSIDALVHVENRLDQPIGQIAVSIAAEQRLGTTRALLWAGLLQHHPKVTERDVGERIIRTVGLPEVAGYVGEALLRAFPKKEEAGEAAENPLMATAAAGTG